jgi:integral membrane protein
VPTDDPEENPVKAALTRYRVLAYATGVFLVLLTVNLVIKYGFDGEGLGAWLAIVHGWLYLAYVVVAVDLWFRTRLPFWRSVLVVVAGTVPLASFAAERWVTNRVTPMLAQEHPGGPRSAPAQVT